MNEPDDPYRFGPLLNELDRLQAPTGYHFRDTYFSFATGCAEFGSYLIPANVPKLDEEWMMGLDGFNETAQSAVFAHRQWFNSATTTRNKRPCSPEEEGLWGFLAYNQFGGWRGCGGTWPQEDVEGFVAFVKEKYGDVLARNIQRADVAFFRQLIEELKPTGRPSGRPTPFHKDADALDLTKVVIFGWMPYFWLMSRRAVEAFFAEVLCYRHFNWEFFRRIRNKYGLVGHPSSPITDILALPMVRLCSRLPTQCLPRRPRVNLVLYCPSRSPSAIGCSFSRPAMSSYRLDQLPFLSRLHPQLQIQAYSP